ncbi:hypothetical protein KIN20_033959 [Parelaphostrongylus tenuis]|uniref:Uncharacterized protein n=1 Tax=Parelaphostrongylus tenuis TaxID=148309 RepID=A0AAD5WJN7_PARTN|nr:hypothetical protein KIN20_033959 [Parelaphostrongylus tenuis]
MEWVLWKTPTYSSRMLRNVVAQWLVMRCIRKQRDKQRCFGYLRYSDAEDRHKSTEQRHTRNSRRKEPSRNVGGVGFVVHPHPSITHLGDLYEIVSFRLAILPHHLKRNPKITVIDCYSQTGAADGHELDAFHHQLEEDIRNDKAYYKVVVGYFNARLGMANESVYRLENLD